MEGTLATILIFGGNFAPGNWMFCAGQLLQISQYDALFSLIGTTYGGDGQTTFALPDLQGRTPVGTGTGGGLNPVALGERAGVENVTLTQGQMPAHSHLVAPKVGTSSSNADNSKNPANVLATPPSPLYGPVSSGSGTFLGGASIPLNPQGGNAPLSVLQPYLTINYVICVEGIYPSRP